MRTQSISAIIAYMLESGTISASMPMSVSFLANSLPSPPGSDSATVTFRGRLAATDARAAETVLE